MNEQQVDITAGVAVPTGCGPEGHRKGWDDRPACKLGTKPAPQLLAQAGKRDRRFSGKVIAVDLMHLISTHQRGAHDPLVNQSSHGASNTDLGPSGRSPCNLPHGERLTRRNQHG
ncbi:MAG: hypothetical protein ACKOE2_13470 [Actinomycetales bacterium]